MKKMSFNPLLKELNWNTKDNNLFYKKQYYLQHNNTWVNNFTINLCCDKLPTNPKQGDLAFFNGEYYLYYDDTWIKQNTESREEEKSTEKKKKVVQLSCKNCGAPLNINASCCDYCGSWINIEAYGTY